MRIVLLGSPGTPGDPIERWHDDAYEGALQLGWDVTFLRARGSTCEDILREARGADLLLWMRTHDYNIQGGDGRDMLRRVEDLGVATAGLHFDLYWGIRKREARIGEQPWWSAQHVFTADGGNHPWMSRNVNHHWCPPPFGTRYLGYGVPDGHVTKEAVFVGSVISGIHSPHRQRMITWARRQWGSRFAHVGRSRGQKVYGLDLNDLYASSRLVLGDSVLSPCYWSDRLPRTLGRGALLAYPETAGLDQMGFTNEVMIKFPPGNFPHILTRLRSLSAPQRVAMTDAAITLIRERHLWRHRLEYIARVVLDNASDYRCGGTSAEVGRLSRGAQSPGPRGRGTPADENDSPGSEDHW